MGVVIVNGNSIEVPDGASISVVNGTVYIDGNQVGSAVNNQIKIKVEGTLASLTVDRGSVECQNVEGNVKCGGSATAANVGGKVDAGGSVQCGDVGGDVDAGGSVQCGKVNGSVDAGGRFYF
jgi:hypothetical protein